MRPFTTSKMVPENLGKYRIVSPRRIDITNEIKMTIPIVDFNALSARVLLLNMLS
jgi:hypothetical protein